MSYSVDCLSAIILSHHSLVYLLIHFHLYMLSDYMLLFNILVLYDLLLLLHLHYFTNFLVHPYIVRILFCFHHLCYIHYYFQMSNSYLYHMFPPLSMCYHYNWSASDSYFHYIIHHLHLMSITLLIHCMLSYYSLLLIHSHLLFHLVHSYLYSLSGLWLHM